jgi:AbrB family looped-hinge helix DNA binding protein
MSEAIQVQLDDQGDIVIPAEIRERLGLTQGMTFVAEDGEQGQLHLRAQQKLPQVIEEDGVLIVTSPLSPEVADPELLSHSLTDAVREHREQRLASLWQNSEQ